MKLIELIIKHVPRDDIHPDAKFFAQDTCSGVRILFQYLDMPKPKHAGTPGYWGVVRSVGNVFNMYEAAEDARNTVVTREQLNYLWILQDQGYTLVFDGSNPFQNPTDDLVDVIPFNFGPGQILHPRNVAWKNVTAYRVVKNESRPRVEYYELDHADAIIADAIEKVIDRCDSTEWPMPSGVQFSFDVKKGYATGTGDSLIIITRKMWDEYVSRKIRVGDKVKTPSGAIVTVLHIGEKNAFVRYNNGAELAASLNRLTRVSE